MTNWIRIAGESDSPPSTAVELVAEDRIVALFNMQGKFYALDGICPHQGGPLGKGKLCESIVTCPWHGFQFDVRSGRHQTSKSLVHPTIPVKVVENEVFVDIDED